MPEQTMCILDLATAVNCIFIRQSVILAVILKAVLTVLNLLGISLIHLLNTITDIFST